MVNILKHSDELKEYEDNSNKLSYTNKTFDKFPPFWKRFSEIKQYDANLGIFFCIFTFNFLAGRAMVLTEPTLHCFDYVEFGEKFDENGIRFKIGDASGRSIEAFIPTQKDLNIAKYKEIVFMGAAIHKKGKFFYPVHGYRVIFLI